MPRVRTPIEARLLGFSVPTLLFLAGCSGSHSSILIDPDAIGSDQGTLISIGDIRTVAQEMVESMNSSRQLSRLRRESPLRIRVGNIKQRTSIAIFDKEIFINRLLASLSAADRDGNYAFLRRDPFVLEAEARGEAATGADLVLSGELRELLFREPVQGGGELEKRTIQYTLALATVRGGELVWGHSHEIVKAQIQGAVYR